MSEIKKYEKEMRVNAFIRKSGITLEDMQEIFSMDSLNPNMKIKVYNNTPNICIEKLNASELADLARLINREIRKREIVSQIDDLNTELFALNSLGEL